jgi:hypothetical protein
MAGFPAIPIDLRPALADGRRVEQRAGRQFLPGVLFRPAHPLSAYRGVFLK